MVTSITKIEYFFFAIIALMFLVSAGKYYADQDAYKRISFAADRYTGRLQNQFLPLFFSINTDTVNRDQGKVIFSKDKWMFVGNISHEKFITDGDIKTGSLIIRSATENIDSFRVTIDGLGTYIGRNGVAYTDIPYGYSPTDTFSKIEQEDMIPIFGYHFIIPDNIPITSPTLQIHVSDFENQIAYATNVMGCEWYTFGEITGDYILKNKKTPQNACVATFDDGTANNFDLAYPILKNYGVRASFYVLAGRIDSSSTYMSWDELDILYREGHEIGSHTIDAGGLINTNEWFGGNITKEELKRQISGSKEMLEGEGYDIRTFAYPLGEWNKAVVQATKDAGYIAVRDTTRDNIWSEKRSSTSSLDPEFLSHMAYYKPEGKSPQQIEKDIGYTGWRQFEEGMRIVNPNSTTSDVFVRSTSKPTDTSYAIVSIEKPGSSIETKFHVSESGQYTIRVFGATTGIGYNNPYENAEYIGALIDNIPVTITKGNPSSCVSNNRWQYCDYFINTNLDKGAHTLLIGTINDRLKLDKYQVIRTIDQADTYSITIEY